tara:strand:+ start:12336 stop:12737 length:402 start_codon:yes stop_codon:yes gene_type:complete
MKKIILFSFTLLFFACSSGDDSEDNPLPAYTVEGKWLWSPDPEDRTYANTMFEFVDGNVYTSYANFTNTNPCTDADFDALDATDRIPGVDTYTFDGNTLIWDEISWAVAFECDGGILINENSYKFWRLNSDCQ